VITVKVRFLGPLFEFTNQRNVNIILDDNSNIKDLLNKLLEKYGKGFKQEIFESEGLSIRPYVLVLLNGLLIQPSRKELSKLLKSQDELTFVYPSTGG